MQSLKRKHTGRVFCNIHDTIVMVDHHANVCLPPRKVLRIVGSSDCRTIHESSTPSPQETLFKMTGCMPQSYLCSDINKKITFVSLPKDLTAWNKEVLAAVRTGNVGELRTLYQQGYNLKCTNRFGETLLHLACRKGLVNVVKFLIEEVQMPANIHDDMGRTPLHDAFWTPEPNPELIDVMATHAPTMLWVQDQRGHCPMQYSRVAHYETWNAYLEKRKVQVHLLIDPSP